MKMQHRTPKAVWRQYLAGLMLGLAATGAGAALFEDDEARRAILELRQRVESLRQNAEAHRSESVQGIGRAGEDNAQLRRSLLDLQNQIETLRAEMAKIRGANEQLSRDNAQLSRELADMQRRQKDLLQGVDDRLRQFEPVKVTLDGRDFMAEPGEKRAYEAALATFRKGEFEAAQGAFIDFFKRYPQSGYGSTVLFWLGNAQYATRDYKEAMINFRALIAREPGHVRAPEAVLSIANCQIELKDARGAKNTLEDLLKAYPQSEAALAAKERLARLR